MYVLSSMILCLLLCSLILFFLFPRSVSITPVSVMSVMVYFSPETVLMKVTVSQLKHTYLDYINNNTEHCTYEFVFCWGLYFIRNVDLSSFMPFCWLIS